MTSINKRTWLKKQREKGRVFAPAPPMPTAFDYDGADTAWSCARKKAYSDGAFARRVARSMLEERGAEVIAYACRHCGSWHIGRAPSG